MSITKAPKDWKKFPCPNPPPPKVKKNPPPPPAKFLVPPLLPPLHAIWKTLPWKPFCQTVPNPQSVSSSNNWRDVKRLSTVTVDPAFTLHFSIKPSTTSPWPRPISVKLVSASQNYSAWRSFTSNEVIHQSLNPKPIWFFSDKLLCSMLPMMEKYAFFSAVVGKSPILFEIEVYFLKYCTNRYLPSVISELPSRWRFENISWKLHLHIAHAIASLWMSGTSGPVKILI